MDKVIPWKELTKIIEPYIPNSTGDTVKKHEEILMKRSKYQQCLSKEVLFKSRYPKASGPMLSYRGDVYGTDLVFDLHGITKPMTIKDLPEVCNYDRFIFLASSYSDKLIQDFQSKVEISLGKYGEKFTIDEPKLMYIPKGLELGPIVFKEIGRPIWFMNLSLSSKFSKVNNETDLNKLMATPKELSGFFDIQAYHGGVKYREQRIKDSELVSIGRDCGGGNLCVFWYNAVNQAFLAPEPPHSHHYDMWNVFFGIDPLHLDDFDCEVGFRFGKESEGVLVDSASVIHIPANMIHRSIDIQRVTKPFNQINLFLSDIYNKDEISSKEGDFKIPEGFEETVTTAMK
jgi:hypothetical protein